MPATIVIPPEEISLADFSGGFMPDVAEQAVPINGLIDTNNLLPDRDTGTLETRAGYKRFSDLLSANPALSDFEVTSLHPFNLRIGDEADTTRWLIAVVRKTPKPSPRVADDVRLYAVNVITGASARIDDADRI